MFAWVVVKLSSIDTRAPCIATGSAIALNEIHKGKAGHSSSAIKLSKAALKSRCQKSPLVSSSAPSISPYVESFVVFSQPPASTIWGTPAPPCSSGCSRGLARSYARTPPASPPFARDTHERHGGDAERPKHPPPPDLRKPLTDHSGPCHI